MLALYRPGRSPSGPESAQLTTPAELDPETGVEITPAVYNTPPTTQVQLRNQVTVLMQGEFEQGQVGAVINKMMEYSKYDGSGDWDYYKSGVNK